MENNKKDTSCCSTKIEVNGATKYLVITVCFIIAWFFSYLNLKVFTDFFTGVCIKLFGISLNDHAGKAVDFFFYESIKVMLLLVFVVFWVGIIRSFFTPNRTRAILAGKKEFAGNMLAALLGVVTPFCSCSAVPLFIGFVTSGVPLGVTFSFLISAPMVNEIALVMLYGLFGLKIALLYMATGLAIAVISGWIIGQLKLEKYLEEWVFEIRKQAGGSEEACFGLSARIKAGFDAILDVVSKIWLYVLLGIAVGSVIHGYVPEGMMASFMGKSVWWAVPLAVLIGIPMYSNAAGIIPVALALLGKGAAVGTVLAFMMSVIALSLPEIIILRKVLKPKLIAVFVGVVGVGIIIVGYFFNIIM